MDDDQQFCLRWNNHQSTLISVFDTLLENGTLVDCTLAAEGKFLKAHKVVLSACSPYFATLLSQQYDKHPIFILKDVKFQELRAMMDYMYRGEVNISQDQLAALLKAAESLQIKGLSDSRSGGPMPSSHKSDGKSSHVPAPKASGLTIENKRPLDANVAGSREGSVSPSTRKRKKVSQRRKSLAESNNLLDNHDQHSNSSSHSNNQQQQQLSNTSATSAPSNNMSVTNKKTDYDSNQQDHSENNGDEVAHVSKRSKHDANTDNKGSDLIEPKNEYDEDDDDDDGNVEDLTMDELEDMEPGPSNAGGSSQGYHWQMDGRSQESQEGDQQRDAQGDGSTFQILRQILDSKNITIDRKSSLKVTQPGSLNNNNNTSSNNNNSSSNNSVPSNNGSQCPHCRRVYPDALAVSRHIKKYCLKEKRFGCIFCQYRSKRKDHIVRHTIRVHDAQLKEKIAAGEFAVPNDAVLKDGILCEPEGEIKDSPNDFTLDFSALYPEITDDAADDDDEEQDAIPVKAEVLDSDYDD